MTAFPSNYRLATNAGRTPATAGVLSTGGAAGDHPLSATHLRELAAARDGAKSIRKAARVAAFNGWTTAAIAAFSILFAVFDWSGLPIAVGLGIVAYNEFRGRKRLLAFDPGGATFLGWNQVGFLAMIILYCLWSLYTNLKAGGNISAELKSYADLDSVLGSTGGFEQLYQSVTYALYGGVIALSAIFQGGNALYYFTRRRLVADYIAQTPEWARDVLHSTS